MNRIQEDDHGTTLEQLHDELDEDRRDEIDEEVRVLDPSNLETRLVNAAQDAFQASPYWGRMTAEERSTLRIGLRRAVRREIPATLQSIAAQGFPHLPASVESVTVKDGLKVVLKVSGEHPRRHDLIDEQGNTIVLVLASPAQFEGRDEDVDGDDDAQQMLDLPAPEDEQAASSIDDTE